MLLVSILSLIIKFNCVFIQPAPECKVSALKVFIFCEKNPQKFIHLKRKRLSICYLTITIIIIIKFFKYCFRFSDKQGSKSAESFRILLFSWFKHFLESVVSFGDSAMKVVTFVFKYFNCLKGKKFFELLPYNTFSTQLPLVIE